MSDDIFIVKFEQSPDGTIFTFQIDGTPVRASETQYEAWKLVNGDAPVNEALEYLE